MALISPDWKIFFAGQNLMYLITSTPHNQAVSSKEIALMTVNEYPGRHNSMIWITLYFDKEKRTTTIVQVGQIYSNGEEPIRKETLIESVLAQINLNQTNWIVCTHRVNGDIARQQIIESIPPSEIQKKMAEQLHNLVHVLFSDFSLSILPLEIVEKIAAQVRENIRSTTTDPELAAKYEAAIEATFRPLLDRGARARAEAEEATSTAETTTTAPVAPAPTAEEVQLADEALDDLLG